MVLTRYKSPEEIRHSLGDSVRLAVFSCAGCANINGIGGRRGLKFLCGTLQGWGYEPVVARSIIGCCSSAVMERAVRAYIEPARSEIDALIQISCAAGIKNANYFNPGLRVAQAADPMGVETILPVGSYFEDNGDDLVAYGMCYPCGHCVLSFTAGVCPVAECALGLAYGYCGNPPESDSRRCTQDPGRECAWRIIEERGGNLEALAKLKRIHAEKAYERIPPVQNEPSAAFKRGTMAYFGARAAVPMADMVYFIR